jgi:hypothetical protein
MIAVYPQPNDESALQQLQIQLANPLPYDLEETRLAEYKNLAPKWQDWKTVKKVCHHCATAVFDRVAVLEQKRAPKEPDGPE